jgi:hypothetical protein
MIKGLYLSLDERWGSGQEVMARDLEMILTIAEMMLPKKRN